MTPDSYAELLKLVGLPYGACPSARAIERACPRIKAETWLCMYGQEQQYKVIKSNHVHKGYAAHHFKRYMQGVDILQLSADVDFPPCMLMRRMLEQVITGPKQVVGDVLRNPQLLDDSLWPPELPAELLPRLRQDIVRCVHADCCYSPLSDVAKQVTGLEFELHLQNLLARAGVPFWTEGDLRKLGFHKTPDIKLKVPVAVRSRTGSVHIIYWIDSKATFGDHRTHVKQVDEQYKTYVNRYGPGLVIYWFGFLDDLKSDAQVLLLDDFPAAENIVHLEVARDVAASARPPA